MKILLTNDDGIEAPGIQALKKELASVSELFIVAPSGARSASGHAISLDKPFIGRDIYENGSWTGISIDGMPADCVKLGLAKYPGGAPDIIVSGINYGLNCGVNIIYSGTVAASIEAAIQGYPSIAVSQKYKNSLPDFSFAARVTRRLLENLKEFRFPPHVILNVNVPHDDPARIKGVRITRQGIPRFRDTFREEKHEDGSTSYILNGIFLDAEEAHDSDTEVLFNDYISISPLTFDYTHGETLETLQQTDREFLKSMLLD